MPNICWPANERYDLIPAVPTDAGLMLSDSNLVHSWEGRCVSGPAGQAFKKLPFGGDVLAYVR